MKKHIPIIIFVASLLSLCYWWVTKRKQAKRRKRPRAAGSLPPSQRARRIFISHSWRLSSRSYQEITRKLSQAGAAIYNHSIPKHKARPIHPKESMRMLFRKQLLWCSKVFVVTHPKLLPSGYVAMELEVAAELGKEVIAIQPHHCPGIPPFIQRYADRIISDRQAELMLSIR